MRDALLRLALLAVAAPALAACGEEKTSKTSDAQRAVEQVNGGTAPEYLREFVEKNGAATTCRLAPRPGREGELLLTLLTDSDDWLQATVHVEQPVLGQDITTGGGMEPARVAELKTQGETCVVDRAYGTLALK
jgi:hypothetical protein